MALADFIGKRVHYVGRVWNVTAVEQDPHSLGAFVDIVRTDDSTIDARVHSSQLAPDTTGGYTWQETLPAPGSRHAGDPRFPLSASNQDRHVRFGRLVDKIAEDLFERSRWSDDNGWDELSETLKDRLRRGVRAVILNQPLTGLPQGVTPLVFRNRVNALLPQDLKDWLVANPQ